jgi:hypothetical protein
MKICSLKRQLLVILGLAGIAISFNSCIPSSTSKYDVSALTVEKKANGYLVAFTANRRIDDVEAFVSQSNWLIVTIAGASVDTEEIKSAKLPDIVQEIQTENFGPSVQVSLKLSRRAGKVEIVRDPESHDFYIDLVDNTEK